MSRYDCGCNDFWLHYATLTVRYNRDGRGEVFSPGQDEEISDCRWFDACRLFSIHQAGAHHKFAIYDLELMLYSQFTN
jgi:hypothetical protein